MRTIERQIRDFFADNHPSMRRLLTWVVGNDDLPIQVDRRRTRGRQTYETEREAILAMIATRSTKTLRERLAVLKRRGS